MGVSNIIATGQLGSASAALQTGGGAVSVNLYNTHTAAIVVYLLVARGSGTARTLRQVSLDAGGALTVSGLPLGPDDVLSGYAATGSKVDYLISTCPEGVPLEIKVYDSAGSVKSGGSSQSLVDVTATGRITTTDSVASGMARIVGGLIKAGVSASDTLLASAGASDFADFATTCVLPANTLKAGTVLRIRGLVRVSNASGSDTLSVKLLIGATTLLTTTAVDPGATTDTHQFEFELTARAAPAATASCVGFGRWTTNTGGTLAHGTALLAATNLATNGELTVKAQAKWSATTADTAAILEVLNVDIVG